MAGGRYRHEISRVCRHRPLERRGGGASVLLCVSLAYTECLPTPGGGGARPLVFVLVVVIDMAGITDGGDPRVQVRKSIQRAWRPCHAKFYSEIFCGVKTEDASLGTPSMGATYYLYKEAAPSQLVVAGNEVKKQYQSITTGKVRVSRCDG